MSNALSDLTPAQQKVFDEWQEARKTYIEMCERKDQMDEAFDMASDKLSVTRTRCRQEDISLEYFVAVYEGEL